MGGACGKGVMWERGHVLWERGHVLNFELTAHRERGHVLNFELTA